MRTVFYVDRARVVAEDIPLTFLLIEVIEQMQDKLGGLDAYQALQIACDWAGLTEQGSLITEKQAESLLQRITAGAAAGAEKPAQSESRRPSKRTFAAEFLKYYEKMPLQDKCLMAANYDFEVARKLYCVYDKEVSESIIRRHFDTEFARMQVGYEAVVFGMGGSFGGSSQPEGEVTDFTPPQDSGDYASAAQDFVNMQKSFRSKAR